MTSWLPVITSLLLVITSGFIVIMNWPLINTICLLVITSWVSRFNEVLKSLKRVYF